MQMENHKDNEITLRDLRTLVEKFVQERDWNQYHTPKALAIALSIEVAELLEHFLFKDSETLSPDNENYQDFNYEMADIFIYLMSLANVLNIESFSQIIFEKMEKNRRKYPIDECRGNKYKKK